MNLLDAFVNYWNAFIWGYVLVFGLLATGVYFTIRTGFVQFTLFKDMIRLLSEPADTQHKGKSISPFKAFTISTASRVGTGNMAGIGIAIALGGAGAIFWMWVVALLGAATGLIESTLAQIYKQEDGAHNFKGGPAYYIRQHLGAHWLSVIFSILVILTFGFVFNAVQSNTISAAFEHAFNFSPLWVGIILSVLTGIIICGGVTRIAHFTQIVVPLLALAYIGLALFTLMSNITEVPAMIMTIFKSAFGVDQAIGGTLGGIILIGVKRGLFSNEAGMGSVPHAAATASVSHPVKQGLIQALGVLVDTLLICSATAFMILLSDQYTHSSLEGIQLLQASLSDQLGNWASIFVAVAVFLFAFSSVIGNYYYGESNIKYLGDKKSWLYGYRALVALVVFGGALAKIQLVWNLADVFMGMMAIINLVAILLLSKLALATLRDYVSQRRANKNPVFDTRRIDGIRGQTYWDKQKHGVKP